MLNRFAEHSDTITAIEEFLSWLGREKNIGLVDLGNGSYVKSQKLIFEFFDIDPAQLERERRGLLAETRR